MIDMVAIVSLSRLFSSAIPSVGEQPRIDHFTSSEIALGRLARGGRLYLITFSPPPEALLLVAILEQPVFDGRRWNAPPSQISVTDISALRSKLRFESGAGLPGMWCEGCKQTHWYGQQLDALTSEDRALLDQASGFSPTVTGATTVMTTGSGKQPGPLLDAILEDPASDDARRVYADELLAANDLRGEYILIDLALADRLSIRKRQALTARRAHLLAGHSAIWWPYALAERRTERGFLQAVHGTWQQIAAVASELFASEPVTELGLLDAADEQLTALLASPWLSRIGRLLLRGLASDAAFARLASSPALAALGALNVTRNDLGSSALAHPALALPRLRNLVLTGNPIADAGLAHLRAWPALVELETLYASNCGLTERGLEALLEGVPLAKLAKLAVSEHRFGDAGADVIASRASCLPALAHLELVDCAISESGALALARALPQLRRLDVRDNDLDASLGRADARIRV